MDLAGAGSATDEDSARGALADAGGRRRWERRGRWCGVSMMRSVHVGKQRSGGGGGRGAIGVGREEETQAAVQRDGASWASQTGAGAELAAAQVVVVAGVVGVVVVRVRVVDGGWMPRVSVWVRLHAVCCMRHGGWRRRRRWGRMGTTQGPGRGASGYGQRAATAAPVPWGMTDLRGACVSRTLGVCGPRVRRQPASHSPGASWVPRLCVLGGRGQGAGAACAGCAGAPHWCRRGGSAWCRARVSIVARPSAPHFL